MYVRLAGQRLAVLSVLISARRRVSYLEDDREDDYRELTTLQNKECLQRDYSLPFRVLRRPGYAVSGGQGQVQQACKLRKAWKAPNDAYLHAGLVVPTYGNTSRLPPGGFNDVPAGYCRGEVHSDIVCGHVLDDDLHCQWCYTYEQVTLTAGEG